MYRNYFKRLLDILFSFSGIIILLPVLIMLYILVNFFIGRPVIFKQIRPGKDCKLFTMYKFRTMTNKKNADNELLPDSLRLTKFGKILRNTSLDELPELFNILKGDMSVVGPRPQLVKDMVFFTDEIKIRQSVYPGLTGLAQINGRNNISWEEKFKWDLEYIRDITFAKDIRIIYRTFFKVAKQENINTAGMDTSEDYGDYLLRTGIISQSEYNAKIKISKKIMEDV